MSPIETSILKFVIPAIGTAVIATRLRRNPLLTDGLVRPTAVQALLWTAIYLGWMIGTDLVMDWRGPWDFDPWRAAPVVSSIFRVLAVVIAGPLLEEIVFRGVGFSALARTRLGAPGAIVVTALAWSLLHVEYSVGVIAVIGVAGLILGAARWRSGSLYLTVAMHMMWNLYAVW